MLLAGVPGRRTLRRTASSLAQVLLDGNTIAWFRQGVGITVTGLGVSAWADALGGAQVLLQNTDAARPPLAANGSVGPFDGVNHTLLVAASVQAQPFTWYFSGTQISWTSLATIIGDRTNDLGILQQGLTPQIGLANTANAPTITGPATGSRFVTCAVWNGAASTIRLNAGAATTGNPGAAAMARFSVAARAGNISGNIQVNHIILRSGADSETNQQRISRALMGM